jgi:O-antigen ligase
VIQNRAGRRTIRSKPLLSSDTLKLSLAAGAIAAFGGLVLGFGGPLAAVAVVLAVVGAAIVLRDLEIGFWGIVIVASLLPFATIPVDIGITPTLLDLALGATVAIWALRIATGHRSTIVTGPVTIPIVVFVLLAIFTFIFGLANGPLTPNLLRHFAELLLSIGFVLVVVDFINTVQRLERLTKIILLSGAGAAAIAIFLWLLPDLRANDILGVLQRVGYPGGLVIRYIEDNPELAERAIGTSVDPNALGGLLLMVGALAAPQVVARRPLFRRWLTFGLAAVLFVCLMLTFSRGAMIGLACGLLYLAMLRYRRLLPYLAILGLLVLLLPVTQGYVGRFAEGFLGQDLATQMRFGEYRDALTLILRYPVFGVGFAGSPDIDLYLGVASVYLTIGQQMGILGLLAFIAVVATVFGYSFVNRRYLRRNEQVEPIWLGFHAALVGALAAGVFDHYLFNIDFHHAVTLFWLYLGLAVASTRLGIPEQKRDHKKIART